MWVDDDLTWHTPTYMTHGDASQLGMNSSGSPATTFVTSDQDLWQRVIATFIK